MKVMLRILIAGIPMDLLLQLIFTYVLPVPEWGLSKDMGLLGSFFSEAGWTFVTTPYMVMIVMGIMWLRRGREMPG